MVLKKTTSLKLSLLFTLNIWIFLTPSSSWASEIHTQTLSTQIYTRTVLGTEVAHQLLKFKELFGNFEGIESFSYVIQSLGTLLESKSQNITSIDQINLNTYPFKLNATGVNFFQSIFKQHIIPKEVAFLTLTGRIGGQSVNHFYKEGMNEIPYAFSFNSQNTNYLFELQNLFTIKSIPFKKETLQKIESRLLPENQSKKTINLLWTNTPKLVDPIKDSSGKEFKGLLKLYDISGTQVFSPRDGSSSDFQDVIAAHQQLFRNKHIREVGIGSGVLSLLFHKIGVKSFEGTEIDFASYLLSNWNFFHALNKEEITSPQNKFILGDNTNSISNAEVYIFNTPIIVNDNELDKYSDFYEKGGYLISKNSFMEIFNDIKSRLSTGKGRFIFRFISPFLNDYYINDPRLPSEDIDSIAINNKQKGILFFEDHGFEVEYLDYQNSIMMISNYNSSKDSFGNSLLTIAELSA